MCREHISFLKTTLIPTGKVYIEQAKVFYNFLTKREMGQDSRIAWVTDEVFWVGKCFQAEHSAVKGENLEKRIGLCVQIWR